MRKHVLNAITFLLVATLMFLFCWGVLAAHGATRHDHGRKWRATYNSALSLHEAAVPSHYAHPGDKILLRYHHRKLIVHASSLSRFSTAATTR